MDSSQAPEGVSDAEAREQGARESSPQAEREPSTPCKVQVKVEQETSSKATPQRKLTDFFGQGQAPKPIETHSKLRKALSANSLAAFEADLEQEKASNKAAELATLKRKLDRIEQPDQRPQRGVARKGKKSGRPRGRILTHKKHKREHGGPILRRDPTAQHKLAIVRAW